MATTSLKPTTIFCLPEVESFRGVTPGKLYLKSSNSSRISFVSRKFDVKCRVPPTSYKKSAVNLSSRSIPKFLVWAVDGETVEAQTETQESSPIPETENGAEAEVENSDGGDASDEVNATEAQKQVSSVVLDSLLLYKEALAINDISKAAEIESFLKVIEDDKIELERKVVSLTEELSLEKDRILRISADFDNFRKRAERERLSVASNAQGEVLEKLLQVLDNFERAKAQVKIETEAEEKISASYQSIYKQFVEILGSLGVVAVETVGKPFDPMLHEAIMREDSTEYDDGIIIQEFRKGFQLGDRLLRPSMVKVSAGPGPEKSSTTEQENVEAGETNEEVTSETPATDA